MLIKDLFESLISSGQYSLDARYHFFNQKLFNNSLPDVRLSWSNDKNKSGLTTAQSTKGPNNTVNVVPGSISIQLSNQFKRSPEIFDSILIHEMIHVYFFANHDFMQGHGSKFKAMASRFSHQLGFDIPLTDDMKDAMSIGLVRPVCVKLITTKQHSSIYEIIDGTEWNSGAKQLQLEARSLVSSGHAINVEFFSTSTIIWEDLAKQMAGKGTFTSDNEDVLSDLKHNGQLLFSVTNSH
jgi:hypothetical protein